MQEACAGGRARLLQMWELEVGRGVVRIKNGALVLAGKSRFLPPKEWTRIYLPFRLEVEGGITISSALQRPGLVTGAVRLAGGQLRMDIYNSTDEVVKLTAKTQMICLGGLSKLEIVMIEGCGVISEEISKEQLTEEIRRTYPQVGDLTDHPIIGPMKDLVVRAHEVDWTEPSTIGQRTPISMEKGACRKKVEEQLEKYVQKGYLRKVAAGEKVFLNPLYPIPKKDGSYRFVNDFRLLNAYFKRKGMEQVDVWRRLWKIKPEWKVYAQLDLKDGFFGIPVDETLQRAFAFTWEDKRFTWLRLPQGWTWSPILFSERVAGIFSGLDVVQFVDDVLVGAETEEELRSKLLQVFGRMNKYGLKVNWDKTTFLSTKIKFLGVEIGQGCWSLHEYLASKIRQLGRIERWKDLERLIGVLSYARKTVVGMEEHLSSLRTRLTAAKEEARGTEWWSETREIVRRTIFCILDKQVFLTLPGVDTQRYVLETDWSGDFAGYMLFAETPEGSKLVDLGSKRIREKSSSFLGELKAVVWGCKATKAFRGDTPVLIRSDNLALVDRLKSGFKEVEDKRILRLFGWLLGNESFSLEFIPGEQNQGADLLSRPRKGAVVGNLICATSNQTKLIEKAHRGHWCYEKTLENLKQIYSPLWPGAKDEVRDFVRRCPNCQRFGPVRRSPPFKAWTYSRPNEIIFADFLGPLRWPEETGESAYVLLIIDGFTRFLQLTLGKGPTQEVVARGIRRWTGRFGAPSKIVVDQGTAFTSSTVRKCCADQGIELCFVGVEAHWSNGMAERAIGTITGRIKRAGPESEWSNLVKRAERDYNHAVHSAIGISPAEIMLGTKPNGSKLNKKELEEKRRSAHARDLHRRTRNRTRHRNQRKVNFSMGSEVLVKIRRASKLEPEWEGPYRIVGRKGSRLYELEGFSGYFGLRHARHLKPVSMD